eukprot:CAMPEP_0172528024 /NCGR_PEP_ID=MMETSP1067-20121228/2543_1 /TAXON_ID=265564 ORGANISM="Thalassiosira punctigera, Strain Tpunct2005C2" /NCGR_SAMPLE_ID=MMETSP1067 /ASSEMBLY_ACC=CAM_ASM_000444 /LENGTH=102 /DNA_ID=CAMNT_0013311875 /DNA_START=33 /DNA_END=341 /DNA_ORIENTATION=+
MVCSDHKFILWASLRLELENGCGAPPWGWNMRQRVKTSDGLPQAVATIATGGKASVIFSMSLLESAQHIEKRQQIKAHFIHNMQGHSTPNPKILHHFCSSPP